MGVSGNGGDQQPDRSAAAIQGGKHLFYHSITFFKMQIGILQGEALGKMQASWSHSFQAWIPGKERTDPQRPVQFWGTLSMLTMVG